MHIQHNLRGIFLSPGEFFASSCRCSEGVKCVKCSKWNFANIFSGQHYRYTLYTFKHLLLLLLCCSCPAAVYLHGKYFWAYDKVKQIELFTLHLSWRAAAADENLKIQHENKFNLQNKQNKQFPSLLRECEWIFSGF